MCFVKLASDGCEGRISSTCDRIFQGGGLQSRLEVPQILEEKGDHRSIDGETLISLMQDFFSRGASFRFRARGWSMTPFIKDGDIITVTPSAVVQPKIGMVVASIHPEEFIYPKHF